MSQNDEPKKERSLYIMKVIKEVGGVGWTGKRIPESETRSTESILKYLREAGLLKGSRWEVERDDDGIWIGKDDVAEFVLTYT